MKSWGSRYFKFNRTDNIIQAVSTTIIEKNTIILYEKPISPQDYNYEIFLAACAKKIGESKTMLPCIFNTTDEDLLSIDTDINHVLGDSTNKNRVFKLAMVFDTVNISTSFSLKKNLYIAIQSVVECSSGNCARVVLPNGDAFIITTSVIPTETVLGVDINSNMNDFVNNTIRLKNSILLDCKTTDVKMEKILSNLFELLDECVPIEITHEENDLMFTKMKDYGIRKHLGLTGFRDQMNELRSSIVDFTNNQTLDMTEIEEEFERLVRDSEKN